MLTYDTLTSLPADVAGPSYALDAVTPGIIHFGVGNFFRAHLAYYIDRALALPDSQHWGIIGVGLRAGERSEKKEKDFAAQHGLYSLTETATDGTRHTRVMGALRDYLLAPREPETVLDLLAAPSTKIASLTITEGGYNIDETTGQFRLSFPPVQEDLADPTHPKTVFGFIVEGLRRRRDAGHGGLTILSCDNLRQNGEVSRKAFLGYARAVDGELAEWIEANVTFPNAMVDRITPSVSAETAAKLNKQSGLDDLKPLLAEDFTQWVVEDKFAAGRPALEKVGVQFSDAVADYEHAKIRMLNASHLIISAAGMLQNVPLVDQVLAEPKVRQFVDEVLDRDVIPTLHAPEGVDLREYKQTILNRFANPALADQVARIAADSTSKAQVFWTETVRSVLSRDHDHTRVAYFLALQLELMRGRQEDGQSFDLPEPVLTDEQRNIARSDDYRASLALPGFDSWRDLLTSKVEDDIVAFRQAIREKGVLESLPL
ncbi:mannitol dehydrogenase family protein [Saccharibacter floricola]|uniref:NADPH-dependent L-sorbose reductase n=1 Tax=Saccharibacter floricola DSM 15669 TaxID=1123227 RepID=A0ABQ0NYF6_9PROT|nr:mannitol dehydrogenase family protein [Saccharibacter floricola]GBQ06547.1 NADPH-dependent L-sorbose reductase [Saccharibacter floricola DSM 15669]